MPLSDARRFAVASLAANVENARLVARLRGAIVVDDAASFALIAAWRGKTTEGPASRALRRMRLRSSYATMTRSL